LEETPGHTGRIRISFATEARGAAVRMDSCAIAQFRRAIQMQSKDEAYWADTSRLMWITLGMWLFFGYIVHMFVVPLNNIVILGFPLGFYMAAQGSLIAFVVILFWFAKKQDEIDHKHGVAEDE
jgi:putative solute:sodium symporter small subunit